MEAGPLRSYLAEASRVLGNIEIEPLARAITTLAEARARGGTIFTAGNGGSAATASHLALDLQKAVRPDGRGTRAVALSDSVGLITAWANDASFERVFAEQLAVLARPGDALVVYSVSGSSPNLVALMDVARERGVVTVALLGGDGGRVGTMADHPVVVRSPDYGWVESAHLVLEHVIVYALRGGPATLGARG